MRLLSLALLLACGNATAMCTKDIECKGDRICEKGVCVAPPPAPASPKAVSPAAPTQAPAKAGTAASSAPTLDEFRSDTELALRCGSPPFPERFLAKFRQWGFVGKDPVVVEDGIATFQVKKPLDLFGFRVRNVHVFPASPDAPRFPGTIAATQVAVTVAGKEDDVRKAVEKGLLAYQEVSLSRPPNSNDKTPLVTITCAAS